MVDAAPAFNVGLPSWDPEDIARSLVSVGVAWRYWSKQQPRLLMVVGTVPWCPVRLCLPCLAQRQWEVDLVVPR